LQLRKKNAFLLLKLNAPVCLLLLLCGTHHLHASRALVDDAGRKVVVPDRARRIICLAPSVSDDVFSIGAGSQVVAVDELTRQPVEATKKPNIGSPATPSLENILALHPDLVIGTVGINRPETVRLLEQRGITMYMVSTVGLAGIYSSLEKIGEATGRQANAAALIRKLHLREAALRQQSARRAVVRVFVPLWYDPIFTIGKGAFMTDLLSIVGLRSVTDDVAQEWPTVSLEAVIARNPDALLLLGDDPVTRMNKLATMPGWSTLSAVKGRKAFHIDNRLELPSPICFDALEDLARQLPAR
jgi:ABC-type Fe3+-hydroxamate transport system substrate-binding protein